MLYQLQWHRLEWQSGYIDSFLFQKGPSYTENHWIEGQSLTVTLFRSPSAVTVSDRACTPYSGLTRHLHWHEHGLSKPSLYCWRKSRKIVHNIRPPMSLYRWHTEMPMQARKRARPIYWQWQRWQRCSNSMPSRHRYPPLPIHCVDPWAHDTRPWPCRFDHETKWQYKNKWAVGNDCLGTTVSFALLS